MTAADNLDVAGIREAAVAKIELASHDEALSTAKEANKQ